MSDGLEWLICDEPCKAMDARSGCHCAKARDEIARLKAEVTRLRSALRGVIRVADRKTVEFDAARAALTPSQENGDGE
jgi:hypothetical protein